MQKDTNKLTPDDGHVCFRNTNAKPTYPLALSLKAAGHPDYKEPLTYEKPIVHAVPAGGCELMYRFVMNNFDIERKPRRFTLLFEVYDGERYIILDGVEMGNWARCPSSFFYHKKVHIPYWAELIRIVIVYPDDLGEKPRQVYLNDICLVVQMTQHMV